MDQLDLVRSKTDIIELISSYISLKKAGRNYRALCPFHSEKTPSFMVSPELQIFKCFGCGEAGDAFGFLMKHEGMEFGEALRFLADRAGVKLKRVNFSDKQKQKERLYEINHLASEFYHYLLTKHPAGKPALDYILKRGITRSSIQLFKLGFAPNQWESLVSFLVKKKGYRSDDLQKAGLGIQGRQGVYDRFRGRLMFPLWDHRAHIVGFAGRVLEKTREKEGKYVNSPETLIYHKSNSLYGLYQTRSYLKKAKKAVVVEGELDMISSYQAGVKNVVAIKGSAFTEEQVSLLKRFVDSVILALDADVAGEKATLRSISLAESQGFDVRVVAIKGGKDPDELAQKDPLAWRKLIKQAVSIYDFYIASAQRRFGIKTGEAKKKVSQMVLPALARIDNEVMKAHYIKKLAMVLKVSEEVVIKELLKVKAGVVKIKAASLPIKQEKSRREKLEDYILSLVLKTGLKSKDWLSSFDLSLISQRGVRKVLKETVKAFKNLKKFEIDKFVTGLSEELKVLAQEAFLKEESLADGRLLKELTKAAVKLEEVSVREKLTELSEKIRTAEEQNQPAKLKRFQKEFVQLTKKLKDYL